MDVLGEAIDISGRDSVNEASLANTIATDETVLAALDQLQVGILNQMVSSNDNVDGKVDIGLEILALVVADSWWGNLIFLLVEFSQFPVHLELFLSSCLGLRFLKRRHLTGLLNSLLFLF